MKNIIIVIVAGLILGNILLKLSSNKESGNSSSPQKSASTENSNPVKPPIPINNKEVRFFGYSYTISGTVREIASQGSNYKITLNTSEESIPSFISSPNTVVVKRVGRDDTPSAFAEIKKGSSVLVGVLYDVKNKSWRLSRVIIFNSPTP